MGFLAVVAQEWAGAAIGAAVTEVSGVAIPGSRIVNSAPPKGRLTASICPPCDSTMRLQIDSPSPMPVGLVETNGSKILEPNSLGNPRPVSETRTVTQPGDPLAPAPVDSISTEMVPPSGAASSALSRRFNKT